MGRYFTTAILSIFFVAGLTMLITSFITYKKPRTIKLGKVQVRAYCPCKKCCGEFANGITATGTDAYKPGIAANPDYYPYGTKLFVPGYGIATVDDTGEWVRKTGWIEVRFPLHAQAIMWGTKWLTVELVQ